MALTPGSFGQMIWGAGAAPAIPRTNPIAPAPDPMTGTSSTIPAGYTTQDIGPGKYNILDQNGNVLGVGYKSVHDTLADYQKKSLYDSVTGDDASGYTSSFVGAETTLPPDAEGYAAPDWQQTVFKTRAEAQKALDDLAASDPKHYSLPDYSDNPSNRTLAEWEALGQVLNGKVATLSPEERWRAIRNTQGYVEGLPAKRSWGGLPSNGQAETIAGENALYGSVPVFDKDGKLVGYKLDVSPGSVSSGGENKTGDFGTVTTHNGKSHSWQNAVWREMNPGWDKSAKKLDAAGNVFLPASEVAKFPGWENKDFYDRIDKNNGSGGLIGSVVGSFFGGPIGAAVGNFVGNKIDGVKTSDALKSAAIAAVATYAGNAAGQAIGSQTGSSVAANVAKGAASGAVSAGLHGGNPLEGGARGAAGGLISSAVDATGLDGAAAVVAKEGLKYGINSALVTNPAPRSVGRATQQSQLPVKNFSPGTFGSLVWRS